MKFIEINLTQTRTVTLNTSCILYVEKSADGKALLTLKNGEKYVTNEDYDELIENL